MNIANWLAASARQHPMAAALLTGERVDADYGTFARRAAAIAHDLHERHGLRAGDRVALFMSNRTEYLECLYGIWWVGAVAVPINAKLHGKEVAWILDNAGAACVFVSEETRASLAGVVGSTLLSVDGRDHAGRRFSGLLTEPVSRESDDLAWIFYTSGTTGRPKGAMLSHGNLMAMSLSYLADVDAVDGEDAVVYAAPISHGAGLYNFVHVRLAARHVVPESGGFDGDDLLALAHRLQRVSMFAAPTMVKRLVEAARRRGESGDGIKTIVYGGGPMYLADIQDALATLGPRFVQIYGQGESPMTITVLSRQRHGDIAHPRYLERLKSVGTAHSVVSVRVTGADGLPLPPGEIGEIEVKGATVMQGYWEDPQATGESLRDGWLRTGDVGRLDADGFLTLSDRSKDVIISGGSNIYPREVEEVLLTHPDVREVSVVGEADADWGEVTVACVVLVDGATADSDALDKHCLASIGRFKRPKRYVFLPELPKNNYGKVLKTVLRQTVSSTKSH